MTSKELSFLNDTLKSEETIIKKYQEYEQSIQNQELKSVCSDLVKKHQDNYNQLVQHLNC